MNEVFVKTGLGYREQFKELKKGFNFDSIVYKSETGRSLKARYVEPK